MTPDPAPVDQAATAAALLEAARYISETVGEESPKLPSLTSRAIGHALLALGSAAPEAGPDAALAGLDARLAAVEVALATLTPPST